MKCRKLFRGKDEEVKKKKKDDFPSIKHELSCLKIDQFAECVFQILERSKKSLWIRERFVVYVEFSISFTMLFMSFMISLIWHTSAY
jgi:hypothetical protein